MADESNVVSPLHMDRGPALGNSEDGSGRRALHVINFPYGAPQPSEPFDAITCPVQGDPNTVTFQFRVGGVSGTIVQTIAIDYGTPTPNPFVSVVYT